LLGKLYDAVDCCDLPPTLVEQIDRHAGVPVLVRSIRPACSPNC
jgi:hypothetical protein